MTLAELQAMVSTLAGDEQQNLFLTSQITTYLNWAQREMCRRLAFYQKSITGTALDTGVDSMGGYALPADFSQELQVFWGSPAVKLTRMDYASFYNDLMGGIGTATPFYYTIADYNAAGVQRMLFQPYQSPGRTGISVQVVYTAQPPTLVVGTDVPVLPEICHETMCLYALAKCKLQENDVDAYKLINMDYALRIMELSSYISEADGFSYPVVRSEPMVIDG